jgi:hypothetical protein
MTLGLNDALVPAPIPATTPLPDQQPQSISTPGAVALGFVGAAAGGLVGGWLGKRVGWLAGAIGGAVSLGFLTWAYFSNRLPKPPVA